MRLRYQEPKKIINCRKNNLSLFCKVQVAHYFVLPHIYSLPYFANKAMKFLIFTYEWFSN